MNDHPKPPDAAEVILMAAFSLFLLWASLCGEENYNRMGNWIDGLISLALLMVSIVGAATTIIWGVQAWRGRRR